MGLRPQPQQRCSAWGPHGGDTLTRSRPHHDVALSRSRPRPAPAGWTSFHSHRMKQKTESGGAEHPHRLQGRETTLPWRWAPGGLQGCLGTCEHLWKPGWSRAHWKKWIQAARQSSHIHGDPIAPPPPRLQQSQHCHLPPCQPCLGCPLLRTHRHPPSSWGQLGLTRNG